MPKEAKGPTVDIVEKAMADLETMKVEIVDIDWLKPNDYNPNRQTDDEFEKLKKSIIENGFKQPIVVLEDGTIVDGFHRWKACRDLGMPQIAVVKTNLDDVQRKLATIQFNEARGNEDMELLSAMMRDFEALGVGDRVTDSLGLDEEGWQRLIDYGGTVLDQFPGEQPSAAWEPAPTATGQVESYRTEDGSEAQSVSAAAQAPSPRAGESSVPGLGQHDPGYVAPTVRMSRRIFIFTEDEAKLVDRVLGNEAAAKLVEMCLGLEAAAGGESVKK